MDLQRVISEIQRRHVGRVAAAYAVGGWVLIQVAATVFPLLGWSEDSQKLVVYLVMGGFPLAIVISWLFDFTRQGIQRTEALPEGAPAFKPDAHYYRRATGFVGVGMLIALVAFAGRSRFFPHEGMSAAGVRSIAVLPFVDMSEGRNQGYFADGVSEEILNRLAQIEDLRVPARTSSFALRDKNLSIEEIGKTLNVTAVLEGSVRRVGDSVRVTVRLIDAKSQQEIWQNEYRKQISNILAIQDEIATELVSQLKLQLNPTVKNGALADLHAAPAAVEAYMKGLEQMNRRTDASLRKAANYFEEATEKDPQFALGFAMLAQAYALLPGYGDYSAFEASSKGQAAAARALQMNPSLPEAYAALGQIRQNFEWDFTSAERSYKRAILFNSGYATAHQWRAEALLLLGDYAGSQAEIQTALDLDPVSTSALYAKAYQHITHREYPAANRILDRVLSTNPDYTLALIAKASVMLSLDPQGAASSVDALTDAVTVLKKPLRAILTNDKNAAAAIADLRGRRAASEIALWYALAGLQDQALATIRKAYESGSDANLPLMLLHPAFDAIRTKKEFQAMTSELHMAY